jgi:predicted DNA-binding transcriptional regulator AlpA
MPSTLSVSPPLPPELLTAPQVAALLGVSPRLVWRLAERGELPRPLHIRRCSRWRRADVLSYIERLAATQAAGEAGGE